MRILHVVHQYVPDHVAGTELYTQSVARRQAKAGHEVAVFTPLNQAGQFSIRPTVEEGVRVYRVPVGARSPTAIFRSTFGHAVLPAAFNAVLERERPDIVHLQHMMGVPAAVVDAIRSSATPYIISLHDYWYGCANGQLLTNDTEVLCDGPDERFHNCGRCAAARAGLAAAAGLLGPVVAPVMRRRDALLRPIFAGAGRVLAPNEFVRDIYATMGFPVDHMVINPLGLDALPGPAEHLAAQRAARPAGGLRLSYLGSLSPQKGLHVLIEAINGLPDAISLDISGDPTIFPDYVAETRAMVRHPGVRFNGVLARARLWNVLGDLDALVMPTLWYEASPATIREAFAAGLPVIASDLGAPGSMVRHSVDGLLFPPGDAAALREILRELIEQPERLAELKAHIPPVRTEADHVTQIEATYHATLTSANRGSAINPNTL